MYSTGNSTQYSAITYMEKASNKNGDRYTYIYIYLIRFAVHLKLTQHYKSPILQ